MPKSTAQMIAEMLTENTGTHFLDSGGSYGRHWQRNQGITLKDWENQPSTWLGDKYDLYSKSLFHYLLERVAYEERLDKIFQKFADLPENRDSGWLQLMHEFVAALNPSARGLYADVEPWTHYTYNSGGNFLTQDIQFMLFTCIDDTRIRINNRTYHLPGAETYVLLQIHGGADARGGLTRPRLFTCEGEDMFAESSGYISCTPPEPINPPIPGQVEAFDMPIPEPESHTFYSDDAYNWYPGYATGNETYKAEDFIRENEDGETEFLCPLCQGTINAA